MKFATAKQIDTQSEYIVEFECFTKLRIAFESPSGLNQTQIVEKAAEMAREIFVRDGILITERIAPRHSYSFNTLGIDFSSANILNRSTRPKGTLKIVPSKA